MILRKLLAGIMTVGLVAGASAGAGAVAAASAAPNHTTINAVTSLKVKINRYIQDGTRWQNDVYSVRSGGTITIVNRAASDGPHTFSVVERKDLPRTAGQINNCKICLTLAKEHGANPRVQAPPKFLFVENGTGSSTPPNVDRPGDSAFVAPTPNATVKLKVTATPGTTLYFMCIIHPWMQAKLIVR